MTTIEKLSAALQDHAHSFDYVRRTTDIKLTDKQLEVVVRSRPTNFKLVRVCKRDEAGNAIRPGLLGAKLV
jgi:hypothetical protein